MTATNRWSESGIVRKNMLLRAKLTIKTIPTGLAAIIAASNGSDTRAVNDYYEFNCKSKGLPAFADAPTWTDVTDNPEEPTGYAYAGKSEQIEVIELVTRTPLDSVYGDLLQHQQYGTIFELTYTYDDPHDTYVYTVKVPSVQIVGISPQGGDNTAGSETTIKLLAEGGTAENMPAVTSTTRA